MSETPTIEIRDLYLEYQTYRGRLKVLNGVNFKISPEEKVGIIGEAGCGKTTTMKAILGILSNNAVITGGDILIRGKNKINFTNHEIMKFRRISASMIFEDPSASLNPILTIGDQIKDAFKYYLIEKINKKIKKEELFELSIKALKDVAMPDPERIMKNFPLQLSGGMKQRIIIAMAMHTADELIIADEPTTSLDVTIATQILSLLNELMLEKTISLILISHKLGQVREMVDRVDVMYAGNIIERGEVNSIFSEPLHPYTKGLLESVPRLTAEGVREGIPGEVPNYFNPPKGCRFNPRCKYAMPICKEKFPPTFNTNGREILCYLYGDEKNE